MRRPLSQMHRLIVPKSLTDEGHQLMRDEGSKGHEALVVWAGRARANEHGTFDVEAMIMPHQSAYVADNEVAVVVDGDAIFEMNALLFERGLRLLAQMHTHPGRAYHSDTDEQYSLITAEGGLSVVIPDFASADFDLRSCAVYRLRGGRWMQVVGTDVMDLIAIIEDN